VFQGVSEHKGDIVMSLNEETRAAVKRRRDERDGSAALAREDVREHNPPSDDVKPAAVAIGDTVDHGPGTIVYEVTDVASLADDVLCALLMGEEGAYHKAWVPVVDLLGGAARHHGWRVVRAVDVPKAAEPVPGVVAVGDTFLRLTAVADTWDGGEVVTVESRPHYKSTGQPATMLLCDGHEVAIGQEDSLISGDWQRVPAGYVLPTAVEWHAATVRLIEARRRMKADPRTGTDGIDACIDAMAHMAGMEVPT
jgi:hypothetical protein